MMFFASSSQFESMVSESQAHNLLLAHPEWYEFILLIIYFDKNHLPSWFRWLLLYFLPRQFIKLNTLHCVWWLCSVEIRLKFCPNLLFGHTFFFFFWFGKKWGYYWCWCSKFWRSLISGRTFRNSCAKALSCSMKHSFIFIR